jgi:hypothetical protein
MHSLKAGSRGLIFIVSVPLVVALILAVAFNASAQEGGDPESWLLAAAAQLTDQDVGNLELLNYATANYQALGEQAIVGKVYNHATGALVKVTVDLNGNPIERDLDAENLAAEIANGPLHPVLEARLAGVAADELVSVAFWIAVDYVPSRPTEQLEATQVEAAKAEASEAYQAALTAGREGFLAELEGDGFSPDYTDPISPIVIATLPTSEVQKLAARPDVVHVFLNEGEFKDLGIGYGDATRYVRANLAYKYLHLSGTGVQFGVLECCGEVWYDPAYNGHPLMQGINSSLPGCASNSHATAVTGLIKSGDTNERGVAPNAHINFDSPCNGSIPGTIASLGWLAGASGNYSTAMNHSYGLDANRVVGVTALDAAMDNDVRNGYNTHVIAAGNDCNGFGTGTCNVESPALSYNSIAVGSVEDQKTYTTADDTMSLFSSYVDPISTHGDREKPEVVANGENMNSTLPTSFPPLIGNVGSGTSFASPVVAGVAALIQEANPNLMVWPEEVKAILLGAARYNVEGTNWSDQDGAGGVNGFKAAQTPFFGNHSGHANVACSGTFPINLITFGVNAGDKLKFALAWDTDPNYANYTTQPSSDIDLCITGPGGFVACSSSWDNTYEIVDFRDLPGGGAPAAGAYTAQLYMARCSEPSGFTYYGWGYTK